MNIASFIKTIFTVAIVVVLPLASSSACNAYDITGMWVGNAKGSIFGAEGSVNITSQRGEEILGIIEGGNFFGKAKFEIRGRIQGNYIFGARDGNSFHGYIYPDWTIRGVFKGIDGDTYQVFLQRPYNSYWGVPREPWSYN